MSKYENYDEVCKHYDEHRSAHNVEFIASILSTYLKRSLSEIHLLDAGCGTGNFSKGLLDNDLGKISMLDASPGMLQVAKSKVASYEKEGKVAAIVQHMLPSLPFKDKEFDAVIVIQVLHHLDDHGKGHDNVLEFLKSANRVLKAGGVLCINYCTMEQLRSEAWYYNLIPKAAEAMANRLLPRHEFFKAIEEAGFTDISEFVTFDRSYFSSESLRPANGIRDPDWRKLDSVWKLAEETQELEESFRKYDEIVGKGTLDSTIKEHLNKSKCLGQATNLFARKV